MASTEKYLQQLQTDKSNLIAKYNGKGLTIDESATFTDLVNEFDNLPSGGGAAINGRIEQKIVASGSVAKGDFVVATEQTKSTRLPDQSYINTTTTSYNSVKDMQNIYDNNPDTYGYVNKSSGYGYIYTKFPSYSELGLPKDALIVSCGYDVIQTCRTDVPAKTLQTYFYKYTDFSTGSGTILSRDNLSITAWSPIQDSVTVPILLKAEDIENYGFAFVFSVAGSGLSFAIYDYVIKITYIDNGVVKTATTTSDTIAGVANSDGNEGDTIEVYVPGVAEEGTSYMMRMMEMNEGLQDKAAAYDILTGEEE